MTTTINGDTGVSQCQPNSVSQDDLQSGVAGKGPAFRAKRTSAVTLTSGVSANVVYNSIVDDTDSAYDNSTGEFTAPVAGFYLFTATLSFSGTLTRALLDLVVPDGVIRLNDITANLSETALSGSMVVYLDAGQKVRCTCLVIGTSPTYGSMSGVSQFSAALVRAA